MSERRPAIFLGIDIGGTKVAFRAEDADGQEVRRSSFTWAPEADLDEDVDQLRRHLRELGLDAARVTGVGVALPATLDATGRVTAWPNRPAWVGLCWLDLLAEFFPSAEVCCADDGDLAALAEAGHAACADVLYVGVGTGIGGGLVLGGRAHPGLGTGSCELGHVVIDRSGARCTCGRRGCVQAEASGPAILRGAARLRGRPVSFQELGEGVLNRVPWAVGAVEHGCAALAVAVTGVVELVQPELVIVGGGFAAGVPGFVDVVEAHLACLARPGQRLPELRLAALGGESSLYGAVLAARGLAARDRPRPASRASWR
ncbi:ROK family protein [Streptomyces sp. MA5143a]|uniref:ROK family protein n=1 Tax=Streptomyces sp. MA5143a TaxID=2083010 RepID=UPI000D26C8B4|nr:ROK family protein [Streptomyces sp. MA5143a]SPF03997.1 N-acetylmannosamine kinase [Streptomyces sp. MA5143a]